MGMVCSWTFIRKMDTRLFFVVSIIVIGSKVGGVVETNPCICNHGDTKSIYAIPDESGSVVANLTTGECVIVYLTGNGTDSLFFRVQQHWQTAYISNTDSLHVESCDSINQLGSTAVAMVTAPTTSGHTASTNATTNTEPTTRSSPPTLETGCTHGWMHVDSTCYLFTPAVLRTWADASTFCQQQHGHLVYINSQQEQDSVVDFLQKYYQDEITYGVWLGATDQVFEGRWEWSSPDGNNTPLIPGFTFWQHRQPNDHHNQDCALIEVAADFHWDDRHCSDTCTVLCESTPKLMNSVTGKTTTVAKPLSEHCNQGWKLFGNRCYLFKVSSSDKLTWTHAKTECEAMASHLIFIDSQAEQAFVHETLHNSKHATDGLWIGATDKTNEGHWHWMNDHTKYQMTFTAWLHNQPSDGAHEDCAEVNGSHDYLWKDVSCNRDLNYICETSSSWNAVPIVG